jgi:hypothetical protein
MEEEAGVDGLMAYDSVDLEFRILISVCVCRKGVGKERGRQEEDQPPGHIEYLAGIIDNAQTTITTQSCKMLTDFLHIQCW